MTRSMVRAGGGLAAALVLAATVAAPVLACGGLIGPNGAVNLLRTTTFAGYHDGDEHYVTAFQFAGGGGAFGSLTPLPGIPSKVEKGGDWTLQRLHPRDRAPVFLREAAASPAAAAAGDAEVLMEVRIDALDITVLRGGADEVGDVGDRARLPAPARRARGPRLLRRAQPDLPRRGRSTPTRPPSAARRSATGRRSTSPSRPTTRGSRCGSSRSARPARSASMPTSILLTDRTPALLPVPTGDNGLSLDHSAPATASLLDDLRSDRGHGVGAVERVADEGPDRRRGARSSRSTSRSTRPAAAQPVAGHGRPGPARRPGHRSRPRRRPACCSGWRSASVGIGGILLLVRRRPPVRSA